jgi:glycine oxidase
VARGPGDWTSVSATDEKQTYDAIVVGAGMIGLACAWRAAASGARVAVLDRADPLGGATRVAAGMLAPIGELRFGEDELLAMTLAAADLYPEFVAELQRVTGVETGYSRCGALHVALDRDEAAELRRQHELQRSRGMAAEWLGPQACRRLEPGLTPSFHGGVHVPSEAAIDPRALGAALSEALAASGGELRSEAEAEELLLDGDRVRGVRTADGAEHLAPAVVVATGCWSGDAAWLPEAARPPVRPVKGQILELRGPGHEPVSERIVASERVYAVPRPDGRLIVGATVEERGFETTVTAGGVHELLREAYRLLPDVAELELVEAAAGLRPGTPDNLPLVGRGACDGLLLATGHFRNGILLAPLTAAVIASLLAGEAADPRLAAAAPERFASPRAEVPA